MRHWMGMKMAKQSRSVAVLSRSIFDVVAKFGRR